MPQDGRIRVYATIDPTTPIVIAGGTTTVSTSANRSDALPVWAFGLAYDWFNAGWTAPGVNASGAVESTDGPDIAAISIIRVAGAATSTSLASQNSDRKKLIIYNDSTAILYVLLGGGTATSTNFSFKLFAEETYIGVGAGVSNAVTGIWASATGAAQVTELTRN